MRYTALFLLAACALLASCSTDNNAAAEAQQQVDSIVTAKTAFIESRMKHNNDSIIDAMAVARADSMMGKKAQAAPVSSPTDTAAAR